MMIVFKVKSHQLLSATIRSGDNKNQKGLLHLLIEICMNGVG
ncbi:hypothetical protein WMO41_13255 [Ventrimonas sp. CLA-AP-H27]|uniref:Uncharacterized protein n=1 Tax=Ventrimonas faecis TaxID=3133170 RepID=A0ABV1HP77_9FIRM